MDEPAHELKLHPTVKVLLLAVLPAIASAIVGLTKGEHVDDKAEAGYSVTRDDLETLKAQDGDLQVKIGVLGRRDCRRQARSAVRDRAEDGGAGCPADARATDTTTTTTTRADAAPRESKQGARADTSRAGEVTEPMGVPMADPGGKEDPQTRVEDFRVLRSVSGMMVPFLLEHLPATWKAVFATGAGASTRWRARWQRSVSAAGDR